MDLVRAATVAIFSTLMLMGVMGCGGRPGEADEPDDPDDGGSADTRAIDADRNNPFDDVDRDNPPPDRIDVPASTSGFGGGTLIAESPTLQDTRPGTWVDEPPVVRLVDGSGRPIAGERVRFEAVAGGSVVDREAVTDEDGRVVQTGWRAGTSVGFYAMDAAVAGATLRFAVRANSPYAIQLDFRGEIPASIRASFVRAAARWSGVVVNDLRDIALDTQELPEDCDPTPESRPIEIDDLVIVVMLPEIDGVGRIIGRAGPCVVRIADDSPVVGGMELDIDDVTDLESLGRLDEIVLHEMGHVLGVGTLWGDLIENPSLESFGADTRFTGVQATGAFQQLGADDSSVPVENNGEQGSADGHWRESDFGNELMTPRFASFETDLRLSTVTVGSIADLGMYTVNVDAADVFELPVGFRNVREVRGEAFELKHDLIRPSYRLGLEGRMIPIQNTAQR